jgi:hypothetical protein
MNESANTSGLYKVLESKQLREARLGVTTVVAIVSTCVGMGITWGAYANRLKEVEDKAAASASIVAQQQITLAIIQSQNAEILRRLDRMEKK